MDIVPIKFENDELYILDQTRLPHEEIFALQKTVEDVYNSIKTLAVRGAPAIGIAAAYGLYISIRDFNGERENLIEILKKNARYLKTARPTAVNLAWAVDRCVQTSANDNLTASEIKQKVLQEAKKIHAEDEANCIAMGENGLKLLKPEMRILTHCNAGTIATAKYGTCLAPIYLGQERGYNFHVFADETRPLMQGARLTTWELQKAGVDVTLICDNMPATLMQRGMIDAVVTGCDRMAANGDGANKIGTLQVAIMAKEFGIPFYMFVPISTFDASLKSGKEIPIEERAEEEVYKKWFKEPIAPMNTKAFNPAFDVTPAKYITAVVTEKGIIHPPYKEGIKQILEGEPLLPSIQNRQKVD